jgi:coproporphyrinogen III oxidase-like Fe-S oxidoreductase
MMAIRLTEGLPLSIVDLDSGSVAKLRDDGWVTTSETHLNLTALGRHFCSEVALALA